MQIELPMNIETERLLLGALLVMTTADRDAAIRHVSAVWFADAWHRRFFSALAANRGRDFGAEVVQAAKAGDGDRDRSAWWIAQLLVDREGNGNSGRPRSWLVYADELSQLYQARMAVLVKLTDLQETLDAIRIKCAALCQSSVRDEKAIAGTPAVRTRIVLDGVELS